MTTPDPRRPGPALARLNMPILAARMRWPVGALEACLDLENRFPDWHVSWLGENTITGFERPAGYWAVYESIHRVELHTADAGLLAERMAEGVPDHEFRARLCTWCVTNPNPLVVWF